jgi:acyl transferase domain-containing protein
LREILFPSEEKKDETPLKSIYADPILFTIQYALALQWKEWGVKYEKMIGEGIGEYVAACLSEVMKVEDALKLILERARFLQENHSESDARNTNDKLERFKEVLAEVRLQKPRIGYISSLSGEWITNEQAVDPLYWVSHLSESPRTKEGIEELLNSGYNSFLEIGHEEFLDWIINLNRKEWKAIRRFNALPEDGFSFEEVLTTVGKLWSSGVVVDRMSLFKGKKFKRVALPTYPFEKKKYFIEMNAFPDQLAYMQNSNEVEIQPEKVTASVPLQKAEVEEKTKEIWEELLGIEGIKINQDFFDLGGDSLLGVQLVTRLREVFNLNVSIDIVFEFPTIAKMAEEIAGELMEEDDLAEVEQLLREIEVMTDKQK